MTPVESTKRRAMTRARKQRIWKAHDGRCEGCGVEVPMLGKHVHYDHRIAIWYGAGDDDDAAVRPLCDACDAAKLKVDLAQIAKTKRLIRSANPETRKAARMRSGSSFPKGRPTNWPKTKLPSRPFANKPR